MSSNPSMTRTWHTDTYPDIDPRKRPDLSLNGKTIVITGGGRGIGRALSEAFATADVGTIAILGRRQDIVFDTKREIEAKNDNVKLTTHVADVTDISSVRKAAQEIGSWDVLVSNAGYLSTLEPLVEADPEEWWRAFEVFLLKMVLQRKIACV